MAKLTDRLKGCGILYGIGYTVEDLAKIMNAKTPRDIIKYLKVNKIKQGQKKRQPLTTLDEEDYYFLEYIGFTDIVNKLFNEPSSDSLLIENIESLKEIGEQPQLVTQIPVFTKKSKTYDEEVYRFKSLINQPDVNNVCSVCENVGFIYLPHKNGSIGVDSHVCPKCKGNSVKNKVIQKEQISDEELSFYIPNKKYHEEFDSQKLDIGISLPSDIKEKILYRDYLALLDTLLSDFKSGKLPLKTMLLSAPDDFGKKFFVYQAIKEMIRFEYNPSPLIDALEFQDKVQNFKYNELEEYFDYDMLFIELSVSRRINPDTYKYILSTCERKGIPVLFISRLDTPNIINNRQTGFSDWYDIFKDNVFDNDYGHILNVGIVGYSAKEIYDYKVNRIEDFLQNSPVSLKRNSYLPDEHIPVNVPDNLLNIK